MTVIQIDSWREEPCIGCGKTLTGFSKFQLSEKWMSLIKLLFLFFQICLVAFSLRSFCFKWHLSDSFISPVIYLIFSPLTPPSLSRGGKLQGSQSPGPGSRLAGASYPVIYPGQAHPFFVFFFLSTVMACLSNGWWLIELFTCSEFR